MKLPTPRFAVFYNGAENQPEQYDLRLSDAFAHKVEKPEIKLTCRVYNINKGNYSGPICIRKTNRRACT